MGITLNLSLVNSLIEGDSRAPFEQELFREDTQCCVSSLFYDFRQKVCFLFLPYPSITDFSGAISLAQGTDAGVETVLVFSGDELDIAYISGGEGWYARYIRLKVADMTPRISV
tara:strand:+ start:182 stop:523 length:342 start_codon:yes stop_codon:yes gene_type:complete